MKRITLLTALLIFSATLSRSVAQEVISEEQIYNSVVENMHTEQDPVVAPHYYEKRRQNISIRWHNNIRVGIGAPGLVSCLIHTGEISLASDRNNYDNLNTLSDVLYKDRHYWGDQRYYGIFALEYARHVNSWLALGVKTTLMANTVSSYDAITHQKYYNDNFYTASALFNVRFEWLRLDVIQFYSTIGLGFVSHFEYKDNFTIPMVDYTAIGMSIGRSFYGFLELGGGMSGSARAGIGFRFNDKR